ncbi:MAG: transposase [Desulfonauticus sp.]|nr:transposase [Desulfonauticus sp.]
MFCIQEILNLSDSEAIEAYCFNDAVRFAFDLPKNAYMCERTYYYYRSKLMGQAYEIFDSILNNIIEKLNIDLSIQRTDSTLVKTALKNMSKLELFKTTIQKFLTELQKTHKRIYSRIDTELRNRYLPEDENNHWFASCKPTEYGNKLIQMAKDILNLIEMFKEHKKVNQLESFHLLHRLAKEQITVDGEDVKIGVTLEKKGEALVNPHDPDAQYNGYYQQTGYKLNIMETCSMSKDIPNPKLITQVEVAKADVLDQKLLHTSIEKLANKQIQPEITLADNGYDSEANRQKLEQQGIKLVSPPAGEAPEGFGLMDFKVSQDGKELLECPLGNKCLKNKIKPSESKTKSYFDKQTCEQCNHLEGCPVKLSKRRAVISWQWHQPNLETRRRMFSEDQETISLYKQRSGIESTFSHLKNKFGLAKTSRRGYLQNTFQIILSVIGLNIHRAYKWLLRYGGFCQFSKNSFKNREITPELGTLSVFLTLLQHICIMFCCFYQKLCCFYQKQKTKPKFSLTLNS